MFDKMEDLDLCFADSDGNKIFAPFMQSAKNAALDTLAKIEGEDGRNDLQNVITRYQNVDTILKDEHKKSQLNNIFLQNSQITENPDRTFLSSALISKDIVNPFGGEGDLFFVVNKNNQNLNVLSGAPTDGMTSNVEHYVIPHIDMDSEYALVEYRKFLTEKIKIINDDIAKSVGGGEQLDPVIVDEIFVNLEKQKQLCNKLADNHVSSTEAKTKLDEVMKGAKTKEDCAHRIDKLADGHIAKIKYDILKLNKKFEELNKQIDSKIINKQTIEDECWGVYYDLEKKAKNNQNKSKSPYYIENGATMAKFKTFTQIVPDMLLTQFFASHEKSKQSFKSDCGGYRYICLRYLNDTIEKTNDKGAKVKELSRAGEDGKLYVHGDNWEQGKNQSNQNYFEEIIQNTNKGQNNELIASFSNLKPPTKPTDFCGDVDAPISKVCFYVKGIEKYNKDDNFAKNALLTKNGIKKMLPMLCFLGQDAFKDGVFVYDASLTADNHFVNAGSYKDIQAAMFAELANMTDKIDEKQENMIWLNNKVESLKSTAEFVNRYHTNVLNIDLEIIEDLLREMAKNKKHIDRTLASRVSSVETIRTRKSFESDNFITSYNIAPSIHTRNRGNIYTPPKSTKPEPKPRKSLLPQVPSKSFLPSDNSINNSINGFRQKSAQTRLLKEASDLNK